MARIAKASIEARWWPPPTWSRSSACTRSSKRPGANFSGLLPLPPGEDAVVLGRTRWRSCTTASAAARAATCSRSCRRRRTSTSAAPSSTWPNATASPSSTRRRVRAATPSAAAASACARCWSRPAPTTSACCGRGARRPRRRATTCRRAASTEQTARAFRLGYSRGGWQKPARRRPARRASREQELLDAGLVVAGKRGSVYDRFRGRLMFPLADERGRVLGFGARTLGDEKPKYLNSPETPLYHKSEALFGLDKAKPAAVREERVYVVEGYTDVLALVQAGVHQRGRQHGHGAHRAAAAAPGARSRATSTCASTPTRPAWAPWAAPSCWRGAWA